MSSMAKHLTLTVLVLVVGTAAAAAAFVWSGVYDVGADNKHPQLVKALLDTTRKRSVEAHAAKLEVPDLKQDERIVQGAGNYNAMCVQCHLAPGMERTELSKGLYPEPPNLTKSKVDPAQAFWVIKHGIKATGMPAWGVSMKDEYLWNMAAFLQKLPDLDKSGYEQMVASSEGHSHGGGESGGHGHGAAMKDHHDTARSGGHGTEAADAHGQGSSDAKADAASGSSASAPAKASASKPKAKAGGHYDDGHKH